MTQRLSIIIVGGGASGVLLAAHLLRDSAMDLRVTLIEKRSEIGPGVAYSARQQDHVLNVAAPNMSAYAGDPDHFWRWLHERGLVGEDRFVFVSRRHYGTYLGDVLKGLADDGRLQVVHATVRRVAPGTNGVEVVLDSGTSILGHVAVLAVGHEEQPARSKGIAVRVGSSADTPIDRDAPVMILGSGLSMVDAWLTLSQAEHRGPVTVVSRHGLLPHSHRQVEKVELEAADVPFGTGLRYFVDWFRDIVAESAGRGSDWRGVVDALRPFNQRIWQAWSHDARVSFLEHIRPIWNIHRHRLPPDLHQRLADAVSTGQVQLIAGKFLDVRRDGSEVVATVRRKGVANTEEFRVARVYDCGGVSVDVEQSTNPVIGQLVADGTARADRLHIGLDVTEACEVIAVTGSPAERLFAIGPLTRGTFFEIEAIPDIRVQCAELATRLFRNADRVLERRLH
ncbi:FAD/NAD(P)-binding protein [Devosia sp. ZB163]|uniref:FAD/NAD(P)-binding protein n=1 Tax=Devosia sp. ZB163 TaxID=3025938 RepID=UPI0023630F1F|nr:FAD/NAD(P)-binding protein [Devosia sp. ZB163]MDC9826236.1 FAD/NAD(P)-binding protein [Devosia sp. ZB163]